MKFSLEEKKLLISRYLMGESATALCMEKQIASSTFYSWAKIYQPILSSTPDSVTMQEHFLLKRRAEKLDDIIKILKSVDCTVSAPLQERLIALESLYEKFNVHTLCEALDVSRGTFYNHILRNKRNNTTFEKRREEMRTLIKNAYEENRQIYGAGKIRAILASQGHKLSEKYIAELMREMRLRSVSTSSKHDYIRRQEIQNKHNILQQKFNTECPNQVWVSDITCFKSQGKYYYVCIIIDLYSRKVISYRISNKQCTQLVTTAFRRAFEQRSPKAGLIFHSDRGIQYVSYSFQKLLQDNSVTQSFSKSGRPHDNAVAEAFFASLKREELYRKDYRSELDFRRGIEEYIDFYNAKRPHKTLNYKTPNQMEECGVK